MECRAQKNRNIIIQSKIKFWNAFLQISLGKMQKNVSFHNQMFARSNTKIVILFQKYNH